MGVFQIKVRVANPSEPERWFEDLFSVDAGALYSFVPATRLEGIGLMPLRSRELVMADGRHATMQLGEAPFTIEELKETLTCPVVFGPDDSFSQSSAASTAHVSERSVAVASWFDPMCTVPRGRTREIVYANRAT